MVQSIVEVKFHRVKLKKTPRKKIFNKAAEATSDESLYFVIDKKVTYGELYLTAENVFTNKEIVELHMFSARHKTKMRVLARIGRTETFLELKRPMFRAEVQFAAVNKEDFLRMQVLEKQRLAEEAKSGHSGQDPSNRPKMTLTFKRK